MKISSNHKGERVEILIDNEDLIKVKEYTWWIKNGYVYTTTKGGKNRTSIYLHRLVMSDPKGQEIDHINRDKLDNRKENLRFVSKSQNGMNKNGIRGVTKFRNKWRARIKINRKETYLGVFDTYEEALQVRRKVELKVFKEFSNLWETNLNI